MGCVSPGLCWDCCCMRAMQQAATKAWSVLGGGGGGEERVQSTTTLASAPPPTQHDKPVQTETSRRTACHRRAVVAYAASPPPCFVNKQVVSSTEISVMLCTPTLHALYAFTNNEVVDTAGHAPTMTSHTTKKHLTSQASVAPKSAPIPQLTLCHLLPCCRHRWTNQGERRICPEAQHGPPGCGSTPRLYQ